MVNQVLHDYLQQFRLRVRHLPAAVQREVMAELLAHVEDEAARRQRANPAIARVEAAAQAIEEFCPADDLGVAVGPRGGIIRSSTGELLLPVAVLSQEGLGRHAMRTRAWTAVAAAGTGALAVIAVFAVMGALPDAAPDEGGTLADLSNPAGAASQQLVDRVLTNATGQEISAVEVSHGPGDFRLSLRVEGTGCLGARLYDPTGALALDAWYACGDAEAAVTSELVGTWRLELRFQDFDGSLGLRLDPEV